MKKILLLVAIYISAFAYSQEILCIPDSYDAPFDEIELEKLKGNKYSIVVKKDSEILLTETVSYVFLRRGQYGRYRNKSQSVIIKSKRLSRDNPQKSLMRIDELEEKNYLGLCKLY